jgi:hypothetical protein
LTRAWPAPCICTIRRDGTFTRFPSSDAHEHPVIGVKGKRFKATGKPVEYRRIYVWELPVRVYHWINAVALVALCITGYLIGAPIRLFYAAEAYQQYWFGWVRFIHFPGRVRLRLQLPGAALLGIRRQQVRQWNAFFPLQALAAAGDRRRHQGRRA